jgi:hypothetical protein
MEDARRDITFSATTKTAKKVNTIPIPSSIKLTPSIKRPEMAILFPLTILSLSLDLV